MNCSSFWGLTNLSNDYKPAVLVTGAYGGIEHAICDVLSSAGYFIIATDQTKKGDLIVDAYHSADLEVLVNDQDACQNFRNTIIMSIYHRSFAGIINNAGLQILGSTDQLSIGDFQPVMRVNLVA